ncbi:MAG: hypothetical protein WA962_11470 [Ornithinimicrobium sp.]
MTRIRLTFWGLLVVTTLASGVFTRALGAPPSTKTGTTVAVAGLLAVVSGVLALRMLVVATRRRQQATLPASASPAVSATARRRR